MDIVTTSVSEQGAFASVDAYCFQYLVYVTIIQDDFVERMGVTMLA
jgi:hypothetical protein